VTEAFDQKMEELQDINNWDIGAALRVKAHLIHTEATLDLGKLMHTKYNLQIGGNFREYVIVPDGNYFINPKDPVKNLVYSSYGFFVRASKEFFNQKLQLSGVLRGSKNEYFQNNWNPRLTAVYAVSKKDFVRISYQNGYRFPSIFEGFSNINSGGVKRVGGLKVMSEGVFEHSWLKSSIDAFQSAVNKDVNTQGMTTQAAIEKNKGLLQRNNYSYLKPEQMNSFEVGYRSVLLNNKLFVDVDAYYNIYSNFIAQIEASIPNTTDSAAMAAALYDRSKQARYRLWTNSKTIVHNYGTELDLRYVINDHYSVSGNMSYQTLKKTDKNDGLEDGYNTPQWIGNLGINGNHIYQQLGFNIALKYQSKYYYQSFLVNGDVPSLLNADVQVRYSFAKQRLDVKAGATNLLNQYYYSILGGPQVGGFYYTTLTYQIH
jgi:iron complex outermembrane receptor protein